MSNERSVGAAVRTILTGVNDSVILSDTTEVGVMVCNGATLPDLLKFGSRVSKDLGLSLKDTDAIKDKLLDKVDDVSFLLDLIAEYSKDVYSLVGSLTTLQTSGSVAALPIDDLIKVMLKVVEVNTAFFTNRVLPLLKRAVPQK